MGPAVEKRFGPIRMSACEGVHRLGTDLAVTQMADST